MKEIKDQLNWRDIACLPIGRLSSATMSVIPKVIYTVNHISNKIPAEFFIEIDKLIPKFTWKGKWTRIDKGILKEKKHYEVLISDFQT